MSTSRLPVMSQIALPNLRASLTQVSYSGVPTLGSWPQQLKSLRLIDALGAELEHVVALGLVGDDADRVGARGRGKLHAEHAEAARGAPHQHEIAGLHGVRRVAEQHAVGGGEGERIGRRLLPGEMLRLGHELARLHAAELGERAVRRLVAPDALGRREHRIAAVAVLVVAVVLIAVDDDLVADLPALHLVADRPDDAGRVGARRCGTDSCGRRAARSGRRGPPRCRCSSPRRPSRGPAPRPRRCSRSAPPRAASRSAAGRGAPCGSPRRASSPAHGRAAGSRPWRRGLCGSPSGDFNSTTAAMGILRARRTGGDSQGKHYASVNVAPQQCPRRLKGSATAEMARSRPPDAGNPDPDVATLDPASPPARIDRPALG